MLVAHVDGHAGGHSRGVGMSESGRNVHALPSGSRLTPSHGQATGTNRIRVCVNAGGGLVTTLTLGGRNEAGNVSMDAVINWAGG